MENRDFFFSWLNLYRIFIFLHQLGISHLTCVTLPGSLDHRISIWMFRRSPWSDSAKAEGGKPAKSSWRQWRMRDVLWMTCRHTSWRSEKKRRKWPWWLRLVTSTTSAKKAPCPFCHLNYLTLQRKWGRIGAKKAQVSHNHSEDFLEKFITPGVWTTATGWGISMETAPTSCWFTTLSTWAVPELVLCECGLRQHRRCAPTQVSESQQKRWSRSPGCMYVKWGAIENQWLQ